MKNPFLPLLCSLLLLRGLSLHAQEEFFLHQNGLTALYGAGMKYSTYDYNTFRLSGYFKKGVSLSAGFEVIDNNFLPELSIKVYPRLDAVPDNFCFVLGFSDRVFSRTHLFSLNTGFIASFFQKSNFPFSLSGGLDYQTGKGMEIEQSVEGANLIPFAGFTQAFLARTPISPFIGIRYEHWIQSDYDFLILRAGLNFRLGKKV
ncbi:MAG: hypothetical protein U0T82_02050 [Bacteroidales bacterium]